MASKMDVKGITETWVKPLDTNIMILISERVNTIQKRDGQKEYGGIAVSVNTIIHYNVVSKICRARFKSITIKVGGTQEVVFYMSPKATRDETEEVLIAINSFAEGRTVIMGDLNACHTL